MKPLQANDKTLDHAGVLVAERRSLGLATLTALVSTSTLLCCALPILLVSVGLGATVAALTARFPVLVTLAEYHVWMFAVSGALVVLSGWLLWRPAACPSEPRLAALCAITRTWGKRFFRTAVGMWLVGFFFTFLALPLRIWLDA